MAKLGQAEEEGVGPTEILNSPSGSGRDGPSVCSGPLPEVLYRATKLEAPARPETANPA